MKKNKEDPLSHSRRSSHKNKNRFSENRKTVSEKKKMEKICQKPINIG